MFENYRELPPEEKKRIHAIFMAVRNEPLSRERNLAWGFLRGLRYRRIERTTRIQVTPDGKTVEHNRPNRYFLGRVAKILIRHLPELSSWLEDPLHNRSPVKEDCPLVAWIADPEGAVPLPPPRVKTRPLLQISDH